MFVISTAGHVDHGKSTLIQALTGIHPDRLKEEREREMTIDLGFANFALPDGKQIGVVDVPGHRDFIENMLAGVASVDAALLIVAADEGVMPQTREHLAILDLLHINTGVVALTKADMIDDEDWLDLVQEEVAGELATTSLRNAPIVPVSAVTGRGIADLQTALSAQLSNSSPRADLGRPRLNVDRVFTIAGFGTVVTGTLLGGSLRLTDTVEILPNKLPARVRGIQSHDHAVDVIAPGNRTAINLSGVDHRDLQRGNVITAPGYLEPSTRFDAEFQHLTDAHTSLPLKHNAEVKLFVGAAEVTAKARILGGKTELKPGEDGWLQLVLSAPVAVAKGDRFILRRPSPAATIGGGTVIDPHPARRHKPRDTSVVARLKVLSQGTPGEVLVQAIEPDGVLEFRQLVERINLGADALTNAVTEATAATDLHLLDSSAPEKLRASAKTLVASNRYWQAFKSGALTQLGRYHVENPLRLGMQREELKTRIGIKSGRIFNMLLRYGVDQDLWLDAEALVRLPDHTVVLTPAQEAAVARLIQQFENAPYTPPSRKDALAALGADVLTVILSEARLISVSPEVLLAPQAYADMVAFVKAAAVDGVTVANVRDKFNASRKYALGLLEHLDAIGVTKRVGDERVLK